MRGKGNWIRKRLEKQMDACKPNSHIVESQFYSGGYTTSEARKIFCDRYRYQRWLDIEAEASIPPLICPLGVIRLIII